ncbi:Very-long-chain (3R)-3-hydroxyacyl-CoA dehydratase [Melia azedarach]|uniref:Very-long-chain (3R)-3-hydroxyacyl-CoA dehydratase n=1 Tax=Melia azedarach TaxID=155640 RepID=A0ACC1YRP7_MELAZ|nr:Very-long-chain (3R)-3-hydroxyacyl-CoA dehydratase [Melia azedarach]
MSQLAKLYFFTYNSLQAFGWTVAFFRLLSNFLLTKSNTGAYASAGELICWLQTFAFLEVVHGAIGIVPTGLLLPLMQWVGRTLIFVSIARKIDEVQELPSVFITYFAWCLTEVIRYPFYALNSIGPCPFWITYLRYTIFIVLYPTGLAAEMWLIYQALPYIKEKNLYGDFFSVLPFSFDNFLKVLLVLYPFLWLKLYLHMIKQRVSKLGKRHEKKKK